jgi:hypothetical protein
VPRIIRIFKGVSICIVSFGPKSWQHVFCASHFPCETGLGEVLISQVRLYLRDIYRQSGEVTGRTLLSRLVMSNKNFRKLIDNVRNNECKVKCDVMNMYRLYGRPTLVAPQW